MNSVQVIGIVGGGQLGRMLTLAAKPLGFDVVVVDPGDNCPAAQVGAKQIQADLYDENALSELSERADYITVEIEHLDANVLERLARGGAKINPSPKTISLIQDKYEQKVFLAERSIPVAEFTIVNSQKDATQALSNFGGVMLLKTRHGAYDGRGNTKITNASELDAALAEFGSKTLYAEAYVPFVKELAVMVARDMNGNVATYPIVETTHERNICTIVQAPANISNSINNQAIEVATNVANQLEGAGVFGIEMFLNKQEEILINEIAPRVHNSGHYTMDACYTSQFEQHIRAISGLPLGSSAMYVPAAAMINILGEHDRPTVVKNLKEVLSKPATHVHLYGKSPTKVDRKMGHINVTAINAETALKVAKAARNKLEI